MDEYKPNSELSKKKQKEEEKVPEKRVTSTVSSPVIQRKPTAFEKFADSFIKRDLNSIKDQIWKDVIWPRIRGTLMESLDMILPGTSDRSGGRYRSSNGATYTNYNDAYRDRRDYSKEDRTRTANNFGYDNIIFKTRSEAEDCLEQMDAILDKYQLVSLQDLYDYCQLTCPSTYSNYGWDNINSAHIVATSDGYMLKMPKVIPLK